MGMHSKAKYRSLFLAIGHRGSCGYAPENTLSSIQKALDIGVDMIEFDVRLCKTGELMIMHDDTLDRTTNSIGPIADKSLQELNQVTIGSNERIPTLQQVIALVDRKAKLAIELKGPGTALPTTQIIKKALENGWQPEDFYIVSYDHQQLAQFHAELPHIKRCANIGGMLIDLGKYAHKHGFDAVGIEYEYATKQFIDEAHLYGLQVLAFIINDRMIIQHLIKIGVDGIFSDYPDRIPFVPTKSHE